MRHSQISSASAETWRCHAPPRPLSGQSATVARALGYTLTGGDGAAAVPLLDASLLEPLNDAACGAAGGVARAVASARRKEMGRISTRALAAASSPW